HVDRCEEEDASAFAVNALGARYVAEAAEKLGARLIFISTDYVFDGDKKQPYIETDAPAPVNVYGLSKLAGEFFTRYCCTRHYILRTSGLYGLNTCWGKGTNFVDTMLELGQKNHTLPVVEDEVLTPTFTEDLAHQIRGFIEAPPVAGIYHATNEGECSWFEFASEIFSKAGIDMHLTRTTAAAWKAAARRPSYSVLENKALKDAGINTFPHWRDALARYLAKRRRA
ncbi:MAG: dTDP-4-dehydrorhamnose reductase, partial [Candidatus Latescibacterota bacterium]